MTRLPFVYRPISPQYSCRIRQVKHSLYRPVCLARCRYAKARSARSSIRGGTRQRRSARRTTSAAPAAVREQPPQDEREEPVRDLLGGELTARAIPQVHPVDEAED